MKSSKALVAGIVAMTVIPLGITASVGYALLSDDDAPPPVTAEATELPPLEASLVLCKSTDGATSLRGADDGHTIVVDTATKTGSFDGLRCVLDKLGTSEAISAQVESTTAMMGVQTAEQDGIEYRWSYHPDNGLNMTITDE